MTERAHEPMTQKLLDLLAANGQLKQLLVRSIAKAAAINPDPITNPAQDLESYLEYLDWAARALPWQISPWTESYSSLYDQIDQGLAYFYFVLDQPLEELEGITSYNNTLQYLEPLSSWLLEFTRRYGAYLDTPESWCDEYAARVRADSAFLVDRGDYEPDENWHTFNEFFCRRLASEDKRPIVAPGDASYVASPADSVPQGVWDIDAHNCVLSDHAIVIKSGVLRRIDTLLGPSRYRTAFAGGKLTHAFLNVHDYHRYHFPVSGVIKEVLSLPGQVAAGGVTLWDSAVERYRLLGDDTSWQSIETRGLVVVDTEEYGLVACLAVGMSQVSSVNYEPQVMVGAHVKKGDPLGYFLFGGSDFVMIFQKRANFRLTAPTDGARGWAHLQAREEYGRLG